MSGKYHKQAVRRHYGGELAGLAHAQLFRRAAQAGVPGYSTVENLLQTLFYLDTYGVQPHCAVYFGWNDIRNAHLPNLDPAYANFHLLSQIDSMTLRKKPLQVSFSPLTRIVNRSLQAAFDTVPFAPNFLKDPPVPGTDVRLERIFRRNLEAIAAINRERRITHFCWPGVEPSTNAKQRSLRF
jgi:hypothetical protein